jgi:threonylcarbamoyladenosine tRNA methylthiotransferase MtaB
MDKLCPHYHISLQSGCNETLKRMNRKYTIEEYRTIVELLRENIRDVALTTDVMVGFPGETDQEFEQTYKFLEDISFAKMHIFKYSPRKGTPAATFEGQVSPEIKDKRSEKLIALSDFKAMEFNKKFVGRVLDVLFEQEVKDKEGCIEGLTSNYIRVLSRGGMELKGEIKAVKLIDVVDDYISGEIDIPARY